MNIRVRPSAPFIDPKTSQKLSPSGLTFSFFEFNIRLFWRLGVYIMSTLSEEIQLPPGDANTAALLEFVQNNNLSNFSEAQLLQLLTYPNVTKEIVEAVMNYSKSLALTMECNSRLLNFAVEGAEGLDWNQVVGPEFNRVLSFNPPSGGITANSEAALERLAPQTRSQLRLAQHLLRLQVRPQAPN